MIRVIVVDDDPFVCTSLKTILDAENDIDVVDVGTDGTQAVELYERHDPDVLLMDIQMAGGDGLSAGAQILEHHPDACVIFLTTFADDDYIARALHLGAKGYLIKQNASDIAPAVRAVAAGQNVLGDEVVSRLAGDTSSHATTQRLEALGLTDREVQVVELIAQGLDNREISQALYMAEGTVRNHISSILQKLQVRNRTQIAVLYYRLD